MRERPSNTWLPAWMSRLPLWITVLVALVINVAVLHLLLTILRFGGASNDVVNVVAWPFRGFLVVGMFYLLPASVVVSTLSGLEWVFKRVTKEVEGTSLVARLLPLYLRLLPPWMRADAEAQVREFADERDRDRQNGRGMWFTTAKCGWWVVVCLTRLFFRSALSSLVGRLLGP